MANRIVITGTAEVCTSNDGNYCLPECKWYFKDGKNTQIPPACKIYHENLMLLNGTPARSQRCKQNELKESK